MKHQILWRYGMAFTHKLSQGSTSPVVLVDGYAGNGRYSDGTPASAELLIRAAVSAKPGTTYVELVEKDRPFCGQLSELVKEYEASSRRSGWATVSQGKVEQHLPEILQRAKDKHLFLFLDPCGAGLSLKQLSELHRRTPRSWPRTEILLNFNADLGRRVAANAINAERDSVLDDICGGDWWRDAVKQGRLASPDDWEVALRLLVAGYVAKLEEAMPGSRVTAVPVRKRYTNQPVFYLIHTTMSGFGLWEISDAIARATRKWREEHDLRETGGQPSLFAPLDEVDSIAEGKAQVRSNLLNLARQRSFRLADASQQVLEGALGVVTGSEVGDVARAMEKAKEIRLQRHRKPEHYEVHPI